MFDNVQILTEIVKKKLSRTIFRFMLIQLSRPSKYSRTQRRIKIKIELCAIILRVTILYVRFLNELVRFVMRNLIVWLRGRG